MIFPACNANANTGSGQNISVPNDIAAQANAAHAQSSVRLITLDLFRKTQLRRLSASMRNATSCSIYAQGPTRGLLDTLGPVAGLLARRRRTVETARGLRTGTSVWKEK